MDRSRGSIFSATCSPANGVEGYALPTQSSRPRRQPDNLAGSSLPSLPLVLRNYRSPRICTASEPSSPLDTTETAIFTGCGWTKPVIKASRVISLPRLSIAILKNSRKSLMKVSRIFRYYERCGFRYFVKTAHTLFLIIRAWLTNISVQKCLTYYIICIRTHYKINFWANVALVFENLIRINKNCNMNKY